MGYLNNSTITIDAILTKKGRELLAKGRDEFKITQFALADDEIDYDLYNPDHPLGTAYYGSAIENLPIVEALPDETQMMKYKLVTLPPNTPRIPVVSLGGLTTITLNSGESSSPLTPQTVNFQLGNSTFGYTAILADSDVADITATGGSSFASIPAFVGDNEAAQSKTVSGTAFTIIGKTHTDSNKTTSVLIVGNETGGRVLVNITVKKAQVGNFNTAPAGLTS
tara:strand:- start:1930 stop:2601 length:672 start_codon:yes stop_codon:yes gene_type:complete